jgi:translocation and assembly module TamB
MTKRSRFLIFLPAALLLLLTVAMAWLLRSESGARFIFQQANKQIAGQLSVQQLSGNLSSALKLQGITYHDDSVRVSSPDLSLSLDIDIFPPALHLARLDSSSIQIQLLEVSAEDGENSLGDILASLQLPYPVRFGGLKLGEFLILDSDNTELFAAQGIALRGVWNNELELSQAHLNSLDTEWDIAATLQLQPPFKLDGKVNATTVAEIAAGQSLPVQLQAQFKGDLDLLVTELQAQLPAPQSSLFIEGELRDLLATPAWDLELSSKALSWPLVTTPAVALADSEPQVALHDIQLSSQGTLASYDIQGAAQLSGEQIPAGATEMIGTGDINGMRLDHFRFAGTELKLSGQVQLGWQESFAVVVDTAVERLLPGLWLPGWPADHPFSGKLHLNLSDEQLELRDILLEISGLATQFEGGIRYQLSDQQLAGDLNWKSLAWPIGAEHPDWSSEDGQLSLQGSLADWAAEGELQLLVSSFPEGQLQLKATGNNDAVRLTIDRGNVLGGQFAGTAEYQWAEPARWSADLSAEQMSISPLLPEYPGVLSGSILAQGEIEQGNLQVELRRVYGNIRGLDLTAEGKLSLQDSIFSAQGLELKSNSARLELDGSLETGQSLKFLAHADELADVFPEISGRLHASGLVSADAQSPVIDIELEADRIQWGENAIASIRSQDGPNGSRVIEVAEATIAGREVRDLRLTLADKQLKSVQLQALLDKTELQASMLGQLLGNSEGRVSGWQGQVNRLGLNQPGKGSLALQSPAPLKLSTQQLEIGASCLLGARDGQICLQGQWSESGESSLQAGVKQVSLDIVSLFVDMDWAFTHKIDGNFNWKKEAGQPASALAGFSLSPGELLFDKESTHFETGPGVLEFQISEGDLHSGKLQLPIPGSGAINMDFQVAHLLDADEAELQAVLILNLRDLTPLQLVVPYFDVIKGELEADIRIAGSVQKPEFTGHATLVRGHLEAQTAGLVFSDITLAGAVYQYDHTELNGSFRAGEGRGQIKADLHFADFLHPEFSMQLQGEKLLLVNVPDLNLLANPDLDINWTPGKLLLNGRIQVPKAQLSPRYLPASTATESPDLVIVSGQQIVDEQKPLDVALPLKITGQVEVELGPDVNLTLDKATANIYGKSNFIWNDNLVPVGDGSFLVSGKIYAYGQLLSISEGRVSFPRVPADNPNLNIKAEREIFGNSQIKHAGVLVSGTLKRPNLDPYTDPMTTREKALAMLITGSDFDYEQGVGAVEVGMYIAPRLYVSYGIGLFEDQNVISARYDLGKGFGVKATSGQRETGVDISYTIDQ